jgi:hypothetical protein
MGHYKVVCGGEQIVGRSNTLEGANKIVSMHKSARSSKGSETTGAMKQYLVESDPSDYPLTISGAPPLGYTASKPEAVKYKPGERPY